MKLAIRKRKIGNIPILEVVDETMIYEPMPLIIYRICGRENPLF